MKQAIGYIRVSTEAQDEKYGEQAQKDAILEYAKKNGYEVERFFIDVISGAEADKPQWNVILSELVNNPPYEAVIVFKTDRVSRDVQHYYYYEFQLERKGVKLVSTQEHFEGVDPCMAKFLKSTILFMAEQERENIKLRTAGGRRAKAKIGGYAGGRCPLGYNVVDGKFEINPAEAPIVKMVFALRKDGVSYDAIAKMLKEDGFHTKSGGDFTMSHIFYIVRNEKFYKGFYRYGKDKLWVKGQHEAIL